MPFKLDKEDFIFNFIVKPNPPDTKIIHAHNQDGLQTLCGLDVKEDDQVLEKNLPSSWYLRCKYSLWRNNFCKKCASSIFVLEDRE